MQLLVVVVVICHCAAGFVWLKAQAARTGGDRVVLKCFVDLEQSLRTERALLNSQRGQK